MTTIGSLQPFNPDTDDVELWVESYQAFLDANKLSTSTEETRCRGILLSSMGLTTYGLLKNLLQPDEPKTKSVDDLITTLKNHLKPAPKAMAERFRFTQRRQKNGETVAQFLAELRRLATNCKFTDLNDRLRDQFVFGLSSEHAQKQMFVKDEKLTLQDAVDIATAAEAASVSAAVIRGTDTTSQQEQVSVHKTRSKKPFHKKSFQKVSTSKNSQTQQQNDKQETNTKASKCPNCGSSKHSTAKECPHKDVECFSCGKHGHFSRLCKSKAKTSAANVVHLDSIKEIKVITPPPEKKKRILWINLKVNGAAHKWEFDTGCEDSIIGVEDWKSLGSPPLKKSSRVFRTYTQQIFHPLGEIDVDIEYNGQTVRHCIPVSDDTSLFGRDLIFLFKINWEEIDRQCHMLSKTDPHVTSQCVQKLLHEFADVFYPPTATDRIRDFKAKVILKEDAQPKFLKARPLPYAVREKVDLELQLMEQNGVLSRIETSEWASPLVVVPKSDGRVRITGDFKNTVNSQLCVTQYPIAVPEDLFNVVSGGSLFSKLDGTNAYHQMELDESSKKVMVINTHRGLFMYNVLPQGIASSPAIFQEFMDRLLQGIPMSGAYIDDVTCSGSSTQDHINNLREILSRMRKHNYKLSKSKCEFLKPHIIFLGHKITANGIHTTEEKVNSIVKIPSPKDASSLRSFMGFVTFYSKFVKNLGELCACLYRLLCQDVPWRWSAQCERAFQEVKRRLTTAPILAHFTPRTCIGIACDAGPRGIGIVLFHRYDDGTERPIAFASKVLSPTEARYSQIEKEGLSIIYGCKKFFKYLCCVKFVLITDHRPLLAIFGPKSHLPSFAATRLHHWAIYLSSFQYTVEYRKSSQHGNADALSRLPVEDDTTTAAEEIQVREVALATLEAMPFSSSAIQSASSKDPTLSRVIQFVREGWPSHTQDPAIQPYFKRQHELTEVLGVLMWGIRVIIPPKFRNDVLSHLHECHTGMVRMKSLARQFVWWPQIDKDIESTCRSCDYCQETQHDPPSAPLHPWQFPQRAWQRLHMDLAGPLHKQMWLIIVDAYSKWPEVFSMNQNTTTAAVLLKLSETIARFGLPEQIVTDNGRQFTSVEFDQFCIQNGIKHVCSSAYHPRSNGAAERFVQTFKKGMKAPELSVHLRLQRLLMRYRSTPHATTGVSPAELLQGRKLRTALDLLRPDVKSHVAKSQEKQAQAYDKRTKMRVLCVGDAVWVKTHSKNEAKWTRGTVIKIVGPVSYIIEVNGRTMKRHIDQIRLDHIAPVANCPPDALQDGPVALEEDIDSSQDE